MIMNSNFCEKKIIIYFEVINMNLKDRKLQEAKTEGVERPPLQQITYVERLYPASASSEVAPQTDPSAIAASICSSVYPRSFMTSTVALPSMPVGV